MTIITDPRCTNYHQGGHPERPERVSATVDHLKKTEALELKWAQPDEPSAEALERAHTREHIEHIKFPERNFDSDTPAHEGIYYHALRSVGGALSAMRMALEGSHAFSLLRPPGHHATREQAMGFCYFNSIAVSVTEAIASKAGRVAVFDFDVHHGNGTENILLDRENVLFVSVHQAPCYPGTGGSNVGRNCINHPVRPYTQREPYRDVLEQALHQIVAFKPDLIAVSAGFDAYVNDPIAQETLEPEDFEWLGSSIRELSLPFYSVLEGGYSDDLPLLIEAYLRGIRGGASSNQQNHN